MVSNRFRTLASLFCRSAQAISFFLNGLRTLYKKHPGVPQLFFIPRPPSEGPQRESPVALLFPIHHFGLSPKTENLQLITPSEQPRLLRPFARNFFPVPDSAPAAAPALSPSRPFNAAISSSAFTTLSLHNDVRNHINFARRLFQFLHALGPPASTPPPSTSSCIAHAPEFFHHPRTRYRTDAVQPHITTGEVASCVAPIERPISGLIDIAKSRVVPPPTIQTPPAHSMSRAALHHQRKIRQPFNISTSKPRLARPMKRKRELQQHRAQLPRPRAAARIPAAGTVFFRPPWFQLDRCA